MSIKFVRAAAFAMCGAVALSAGSALAQDAKSLDELLGFVKRGQVTEAKENRAREQRFAKDKANQAAELQKAEAERTRQEELSAQLEDAFEENEHFLELDSMLLVRGKFKKDTERENSFSLIAEKVRPLTTSREKLTKSVHAQVQFEDLESLLTASASHQGVFEVY